MNIVTIPPKITTCKQCLVSVNIIIVSVLYTYCIELIELFKQIIDKYMVFVKNYTS